MSRLPFFKGLPALLAAGGLVAAGLPTRAADWQPNEAQVSAQKDLIDPEFSQKLLKLTWVDSNGQVWVASLDPDTGLLKTPDGKEVLVDPDAMKLGEAPFAFNGPEWATSSSSVQITYTKFVPGAPHTQSNARIAVARQQADGSWAPATLSPNRSRSIPFGSPDAAYDTPRISYIDTRGNHYWRETGKQNTEHRIAAATDKQVPLRFVYGAQALLFTAVVDGVHQVHYLDLKTDAVTQLTFDDGDKNSPFMWKAPEFGNEFMLFAAVGNSMRFYRNLPDGTGQPKWTVTRELAPPTGYVLRSPEPFTYGNRSYVFLAMTAQPNDFNSEIWVASADPANPVFKRITPDTPLVGRGDPEIFITGQGARIYFNRYQLQDGAGCHTVTCSEGLWFADPGLPPGP